MGVLIWILHRRYWGIDYCLMLINYSWVVWSIGGFGSEDNFFSVLIFGSIFWACLTWEVLTGQFGCYFFVSAALISFFRGVLKLKSINFFCEGGGRVIEGLDDRISGSRNFILLFSCLFILLFGCFFILLFGYLFI